MDEPMMSQLEIVMATPLAWLALLTWQRLHPGMYQAHVDAYEEWERQCPKEISTERVVTELKERHPELMHELRR